MSEERKLILQMVAEGKISADEAEMLLQTIDETQRTAQSAAAETVRTAETNTGSDWGHVVEQAVNESLRGLDQALRGLEINLERRTYDSDRLRNKVEEKMRRAAERAVEKAREAEERSRERAREAEERARERALHAEERMRHAAERAAERANREVERAAREAERIQREVFQSIHSDEDRERFFKAGVSIDKVTVEKQEQFTMPAQPGDRLVLDNRVGDVHIECYDGDQIEVEVKKVVWGEDEADAEARAAATKVQVVRHGADVVIDILRPIINAVGVVVLKDTRLDLTIRIPHGMHLNVYTKVGDVRLQGGLKVGAWQLATKVGDVKVQVLPEAGFYYTAQTKLGEVVVRLPGASGTSGRVGDGSGNIQMTSKTGDISLYI